MKRNRTQWRDGLARTSWQDFERLLAAHYRGQGYEVEHTGTAQSTSNFDGGVDLVLRREGETTLVQCKHWNVAQVPHNDVHQLIGIVETRGATRAILVTSGEFTSAAREAASRTRRIELVDGAQLRLMVDPRLIPATSADASPSKGLEAWAPVAEKALDAFMHVKFGRSRRGRSRSPRQEIKELGFRLLFGAVLALVAFWIIRQQLMNLPSAMARPAASVPLESERVAATRDPASVQRLAQVKVQGVMKSAGQIVAVVELAGMQANDAGTEICREAEHWLGQSLAGQTLRVQRVRGRNPAVDAGVIRCG